MRWVVVLLVLALSAGVARAQDWEHAAALTETENAEPRLPLGNPHFGVQLDGGLALFVPALITGGHVALAVTLDIVLGRRETFRLAFFGESSTTGPTLSSGSIEAVSTGVRFLFGFDLGIGTAVIRIGGEVGPSLFMTAMRDVSVVGIAANAQARIELAGRALDARNLEIGVAAHGGLDGPPAVFFDAFVTYVFE